PAPPAVPPPGVCCRAWVRCTPRQKSPCYLSALHDQETWTATVRNLCAGGVGLVLERPIDPGRFVFVELENASAPFSRLVLARVAHCSAPNDSGHLLGIEFVEALGAAELRMFLS